MPPSAWQVLCGLEAWLVTQIARRPQRPGATMNLTPAQEQYSCGADCQALPCTLRQMRQARRAAEADPRITWWAELTVLAHLAGWAMPFPGPELTADLRALDQRRLDCALSHAVDDAVAARAAVISARVSPGPMAVHVTAAMRQAVADESWLCEEAEPRYLAPPYRWTLVLEALQQACRDGHAGCHPRSAEREREYGRGIPGQDRAGQLAAVTRWYQDDQRDQARLHAVIWGRRPAPALERAAGPGAGDPDWTERVASLLEVFAGTCRWPLDYLTPPGQAP